jgi:hypothetical protein
MLRRVDGIKDIQGQALRMRGTSPWPHGVFVPASLAAGRAVETAMAAPTPKVSLARRLEQDTRLTGLAANWLFIKGGIIVLLMLGLIVLGLIGLFQKV